jgi:thioredoxin reductase (NADPH)
MSEKKIQFYGAEWCPDCQKAKYLLDKHGCTYEYIDIEKVQGAEEHLTRVGGGKRIIPTLEINGDVLTNPSESELLEALGLAECRKEEFFDVIIIGGGPAGVTGAIYTSRERHKTLLLERTLIGSQFWATEVIENYPGFPEGISGKELADLLEKQGGMFGAEILKGKEATGIELQDGQRIVLAGKERFYGKVIIVATGTTYRKLDAVGEKEFQGKGVSYCATCDAPFFKNRDVIVAGGGNTGFQEGLYLSEVVKSLHIVQKAPQFTASKILQESLFKRDNVSSQLSSEITEISGDKKVEQVTIRNNETGEVTQRKADGVFVFVGQIPNTAFVKDLVECDRWGFIKTRPGSLETNVSGIFAAGDVRAGSTKQIASAAGEGVFASFLVKEAIANWKTA